MLKPFAKDENGNVLVMGGICIGIFLACGAVAIDFSVWQSQRAKLQDAADSAALSGAIMLSDSDQDNGSEDENGDTALKRKIKLALKQMVQESNNTVFEGYSADVEVNQHTEIVSVNLSVDAPRMFSSLFIKTDPTVRVQAAATVVHRDDSTCIYVIDPAASSALKIAGSGELSAPGCRIQVSSASATALSAGSSGGLVSDEICVAGNFSGSGYSTTPTANCDLEDVPYSTKKAPSGGNCDYNNFKATNSGILIPGTYCGGLSIGSDYEMTLSRGRYFIRDGDLKLTGTATLTGDEVIFILQGTGSLNITSSGKFNVTPPRRGRLRGFSIFQDHTSSPGQKAKITGQGDVLIGGTIYAPNIILELTGKAATSTNTPGYSSMVVQQLKIAGTGELKVTKPAKGTGPTETVRLIN